MGHAKGLGNRLEFPFFNQTSMVFPHYVYRKTQFLYNLVKYFKVLNQFSLKVLNDFEILVS